MPSRARGVAIFIQLLATLGLFPIAYTVQCAPSAHYTTLFVSEYKLGHALPRFRLRNQALRAHYTTLFVSEYKLGHALPRFRLRNQSSARTRCIKLFLHRAVRWSSQCSLTYFLFYVVLVAIYCSFNRFLINKFYECAVRQLLVRITGKNCLDSKPGLNLSHW